MPTLGGVYEGTVSRVWGQAVCLRKPRWRMRREQPTERLEWACPRCAQLSVEFSGRPSSAGSVRVSRCGCNTEPPAHLYVHNGCLSVGVGLGGMSECVSGTRCDGQGRRQLV